MAENVEGTAQRHRRSNPKRRREDIYCYDEDIDRNDEELDSDEEERDVILSEEDEDDSFTYGGARNKKVDAKKRKQKSKQNINDRKSKSKKEGLKRDKLELPDADYVDYVYATGSSKNKVELKIFNPDLHIENQHLKKRYEDELEEVYTQFGKKYAKVEEPQSTTRWKYLLKQVEEAGRDFASER